MKQINLTIPYEEEKIEAIRQFSGEGKPSLEQELSALIDRLYHKTVPAPVRDFIAARAETASPITPGRRKNRAVEPPQSTPKAPASEEPADAGY